MKNLNTLFVGAILFLTVQPYAKAEEQKESCFAMQNYLVSTFSLGSEDSKTLEGNGCTVTVSNSVRKENMPGHGSYAKVVVTNSETGESVEIDMNDCSEASNPYGVLARAGDTAEYKAKMNVIDSSLGGFTKKAWEMTITEGSSSLEITAGGDMIFNGTKQNPTPYPRETSQLSCIVSN